MNIDERLDKLTERHEALTMNMELLASEVRDLRGAVERIVTLSENLVETAQNHERRLAKLEGLTS